jgi:hypothetical protein
LDFQMDAPQDQRDAVIRLLEILDFKDRHDFFLCRTSFSRMPAATNASRTES